MVRVQMRSNVIAKHSWVINNKVFERLTVHYCTKRKKKYIYMYFYFNMLTEKESIKLSWTTLNAEVNLAELRHHKTKKLYIQLLTSSAQPNIPELQPLWPSLLHTSLPGSADCGCCRITVVETGAGYMLGAGGWTTLLSG